MPSIEVLLTFTTAALLLGLSPGPSNLYILARSIAQGPRAGFMAAAGLATGGLGHVLATSLGLAAVFVYSPLAFSIFKIMGAGYLIYLGVRHWLQPPQQLESETSVAARPFKQIFRESILVEFTNPKTALFFLAFLPQFVDANAGPVALQIFVLGLIAVMAAIPCDLIIATSAGKAAQWLRNHAQAPLILERVSGSILLVLGLAIVVMEIKGAMSS